MKHQRRQAFSLVELMIVAGIIGILASIVVPRYRGFIAKTKRAEATVFLSHLHSLQELFQQQNNRFTEMSNIGLEPSALTWQCNPELGPYPPSLLGLRISPCGVQKVITADWLRPTVFNALHVPEWARIISFSHL